MTKKISFYQLKKIISEEVDKFLLESEIWVDKDGYAHDDEGNSWYVGSSKQGLYNASNYPGPYPDDQKSSYKSDRGYSQSSEEDSRFNDQLDALDKLYKKTGHVYVDSVRDFLRRRGSLSHKQSSAIKKFLYNAEMKQFVQLFD